MSSVSAIRAAPQPIRLRRLRPLDGLAAWLLGAVPVAYLALSGGGYDIIARSEVALVLWSLVFLGVLIGVLPTARLTTTAWVGLALLGAYLAWTWAAVGWSQSHERTLAEVARVASYLGILAVGLSVVSNRNMRDLLNGLATAIAMVAALAVISRLVPSWFPADSAQGIYATSRLRYPFDYSDAVGEFAAIGLPLLFYIATSARTLWGRALAAAALPVLVLCLVMTVSRGGLLAALVGILVFFALVPERLPRLVTALVAGAGSTVVTWALLSRPAVRDEFLAPGPAEQRHAVLATLLVACAAIALIHAGVTLAARAPAVRSRLQVSPKTGRVIAVLILVAAIAGIVAAIATGTDHRLWQEFKRPNPIVSSNQYHRLLSIAGSHRYQYWQAALHAFHAHPWKGIGPGTFEFYWAQHNSLNEFVRNAHSLYIETLAELGVVGLILIGGFIAFTLTAGTTRALLAPAPGRALIATSVAGFAAFAVSASLDWVWQIGVLPMVAMLLAVGALGRRRTGSPGGGELASRATRLPATRVVLAGGFVAALVAIAVPLTSTIAVRSSQAAARSGDYRSALREALSAQRIEPSAATPRLQRALVLERTGDLLGARKAIAEAESREPTNWRIWLTASRLDAKSGHPQLALADYRRANALNPSSPLFKS